MSATLVDSSVLLDLFTRSLPYFIKESLEEIRYPFEAYLKE